MDPDSREMKPVDPPPDRMITLHLDGRLRRFHLYVPPGGRSCDPCPVLVLLHGRYGSAARIQKETGLATLAGRAGLAVVVPEGVKRSWADGRGLSPADRLGIRDTVFLGRVLDMLQDLLPGKVGEVFLAGHSNGGFMAQSLAVEFPGRFAALGIVAAALSHEQAARLRPEAAVPILVMHGTADPVIPYSGIQRPEGGTLPAEETARRWAVCNACGETVTIEAKGDLRAGMSFRALRYGRPDVSHPVLFYRIEGAGHNWPGTRVPSTSGLFGPVCVDLPASRILLDFFEQIRTRQDEGA